MRCLLLLPFTPALALHLLFVPGTHMEGPVHLLPMIRRMRRRYTLPPRYRHKNKQDLAPLHYQMWRPCRCLFCFACFFHTPTALNTGVPTHSYNTPLQSTSVNSPHDTRYNSKWVLQSGDVHPNSGHRRIYQLLRDYRLVPGPPVPRLDIEEYAQHLVVHEPTIRHRGQRDQRTRPGHKTGHLEHIGRARLRNSTTLGQCSPPCQAMSYRPLRHTRILPRFPTAGGSHHCA